MLVGDDVSRQGPVGVGIAFRHQGTEVFFELLSGFPEDVDVVDEAVQQGLGESLRPEDLGPFVAGKVGGDQDGAALVALAEDLEEQLRPGGGQGDESQLVDDQLVQAGKVLAVHLSKGC